MHRDEADRLAATVRAACPHNVEVVPDGEFFVVQVVRTTESGNDTVMLYDESDWDWLRERTLTAAWEFVSRT